MITRCDIKVGNIECSSFLAKAAFEYPVGDHKGLCEGLYRENGHIGCIAYTGDDCFPKTRLRL